MQLSLVHFTVTFITLVLSSHHGRQHTHERDLCRIEKNADAITRVSEDFHRQIERLEGANHAHMERMEAIQIANESQITQLNSAMTQILQRLQSIPVSSHGASNSNKEQTRTPFQVRSVKLDFPRFDGNNVMDWIFKAE